MADEPVCDVRECTNLATILVTAQWLDSVDSEDDTIYRCSDHEPVYWYTP